MKICKTLSLGEAALQLSSFDRQGSRRILPSFLWRRDKKRGISGAFIRQSIASLMVGIALWGGNPSFAMEDDEVPLEEIQEQKTRSPCPIKQRPKSKSEPPPTDEDTNTVENLIPLANPYQEIGIGKDLGTDTPAPLLFEYYMTTEILKNKIKDLTLRCCILDELCKFPPLLFDMDIDFLLLKDKYTLSLDKESKRILINKHEGRKKELQEGWHMEDLENPNLPSTQDMGSLPFEGKEYEKQDTKKQFLTFFDRIIKNEGALELAKKYPVFRYVKKEKEDPQLEQIKANYEIALSLYNDTLANHRELENKVLDNEILRLYLVIYHEGIKPQECRIRWVLNGTREELNNFAPQPIPIFQHEIKGLNPFSITSLTLTLAGQLIFDKKHLNDIQSSLKNMENLKAVRCEIWQYQPDALKNLLRLFPPLTLLAFTHAPQNVLKELSAQRVEKTRENLKMLKLATFKGYPVGKKEDYLKALQSLLKKLSSLESLDLRGNGNVTEEDIKVLQSSFPKIVINFFNEKGQNE